jgi:hypothetical protein
MNDTADTSQETTPAAETSDDAAIVADAAQTTNTDTDPATWSLDDNIPGQGETPEWFKSDKYKTVAEQAKAYKELESKLGAFTGAPEEYTAVELTEHLTAAGIEIDPEDPLLAKAGEYAKELNMSQEGYSKLINLYGETLAAEQEAIEQLKAEEIKALGQNAENRLNNLKAWGSANLDSELFESFQELAVSANAVKTLERLVAMTRNAPISPAEASPKPGLSSEELNELMFAKDEHGNRKMRNPEYAKMVQEKMDQVHGTEPYRQQIGG